MKYRYLDEAQAKWIRGWWRALQPQEEGKWPPPDWRGLGRAARAMLKRCVGIDQLIVEPSALRLAGKLFETESRTPIAGGFKDDYACVAMAAGALAYVRDDVPDGRSLAAHLGGETPVMSERRFTRLIRTEDLDAFYRQLVRAIQLAGGKLDIAVLADDVIAKCVEQTSRPSNPNFRVQSRWARDYYLAPQARGTLERSLESTVSEVSE